MESNIIRNVFIKVTLENVEMAKFLFGQYVFIAKSLNISSFSHCNSVHTAHCSRVFVQFHFHKALNKTFSDKYALRWKGNYTVYCNIYI